MLLKLHIFDMMHHSKVTTLVIFICIGTRCVQFVLKDNKILYLFKYLKMLIFNPIEAGVLPLLKTIKILYRADFLFVFLLVYCKSPLGLCCLLF